MNKLLFMFPILIIVMCFAFEAYGVQFYEVHDFAPVPDDPFSVEPHSIFSYDQYGDITVDGRQPGNFRLPGLPHEYNDIASSNIYWQYCFKPGCETRSCCPKGIKICFNHWPGYVANCDKFITWRDDEKYVYRDAHHFLNISKAKSDLFDNCWPVPLLLYPLSLNTGYLVGGSVEIGDTGCDAYVKLSGEKIPKCVWRWDAKPEFQCDNRFGGEEAMGSSYEMDIGWSLTNYAQSTGGSKKWAQSGSVSGTHTFSSTGSGDFKPTIEGVSIFSIGASGTTTDNKTNTAGWNHETMKSWAEITTKGTQFTQKVRRNITCKKGEFLSQLQKVWTCGDYVVKTGMFKLWDMSMTKERYAQEGDKWKVEIVFLSDLNITTHVPDKATTHVPAKATTHVPGNTTNASTNVSGNTVHVSTTVLLSIPAFLLLWFG